MRSRHARVPVVSVGNLTVGGTGKTPVVEMIADWYRRHGLRVVILSRGYGVRRGRNDEARLLDENLPDVPHLQGRRRAPLAERAVDEFGAEVILLDDGLQHRRLARNLEIVLIDASCPFGGGWTLPGGLLREPASALKRADIVVMTRVDLLDSEERNQITQVIRRHTTRPPIVEVQFRPVQLQAANGEHLEPDALRGRRVLAFCGIGNPESFRIMLESLGGELVDLMVFPDHHEYSHQEVAVLAEWGLSARVDCLVTTQKDWVKVGALWGGSHHPPLYSLRIRAVVTAGREDFYKALGAMHPRMSGAVARETSLGHDSP